MTSSRKETFKDTEVLAMTRACSRERVARIREKLKKGTKKISFAAKFEGKLVVRPDIEYQNWAAICPWRVLAALAEGGPDILLVRKAMKEALKGKKSLHARVDLLKKMAEAICRQAEPPPMKKQKGTVTFEGIVTRL
jgi:hypothetical protein